MSDPQQAPQQIARQGVRRAMSLAALPEVALQARKLAEDPDCSLPDLAKVFSKDPALCSQLLRVANSALYGLRCEISSIEHAANLLGRKVLRNVALAVSMQAVMPKVRLSNGFSAMTLWQHSIRTAGAASVLAKESGQWDPEEAFAAGLIHDLGMLVELDCHHSAMKVVIEKLDRIEPHAQAEALGPIELSAFGADHQHFGAAICSAWGFPAHLCDAAEHHHDPLLLEGKNRKLAALVCLANMVSCDTEHGIAKAREMSAPNALILECIGVKEPEFLDMLDIMRAAADEMEASL